MILTASRVIPKKSQDAIQATQGRDSRTYMAHWAEPKQLEMELRPTPTNASIAKKHPHKPHAYRPVANQALNKPLRSQQRTAWFTVNCDCQQLHSPA